MDEMADSSEPVNMASPQRSSQEPSDVHLVAQVRDGDEAAFEELFNRNRRRVALIASRFFRQREQIEEIVQESFTKAYFALGDFSNQQEASFAAWMARIAYNSCYDELRRMKRRHESALTDVSDEDASWLKERLHAEEAGGDIESVAITPDLDRKLLASLRAEDRMALALIDEQQ